MTGKKLSQFVKLPLRLKCILLEALTAQYAVWFVLKVIPFRRIPGIFRNPRKPVEVPDEKILLQIREAMVDTYSLACWKNKCLVQSLAARQMLNRRRIASHLSMGVMHDDRNKLLSHAWLRVGDTDVVSSAGSYTEMFSF